MMLNKLEELGYTLVLSEMFQGKYCKCVYAKNYTKDNTRIIIDYMEYGMVILDGEMIGLVETEEIKSISEMVGSDL